MTKKTANTFDPDLVAIFTSLQQWHAGHIETLHAMHDVKDRLVIKAGEESVTLEGATLTGFKTAISVALQLLTPWPVKIEGSVSDPVDAGAIDIDIALLVELDSRLESGDVETARQMIADWIDDLQAEV